MILPAAVPTSTLIVPYDVIVPGTKPAPLTTPVIVPTLPLMGSHCDEPEFHPTNCPLAGPADDIERPCNLVAFTLFSSEPSTAGICAEPFNCRIFPGAVPTSTLIVPLVVIVPGCKP